MQLSILNRYVNIQGDLFKVADSEEAQLTINNKTWFKRGVMEAKRQLEQIT